METALHTDRAVLYCVQHEMTRLGFNSAGEALVSSVPGLHKGNNLNRFGHTRLQTFRRSTCTWAVAVSTASLSSSGKNIVASMTGSVDPVILPANDQQSMGALLLWCDTCRVVPYNNGNNRPVGVEREVQNA